MSITATRQVKAVTITAVRAGVTLELQPVISNVGTAAVTLSTIIRGEKVNFIKHPDNDVVAMATTFEPYDYGFNLKKDAAMLWKVFQWIGGDLDDDNNFIVHDFLRIDNIP